MNDNPQGTEAALEQENALVIPDPVSGPIRGVPASDVRAWIESLATEQKRPTPKARTIR